MPGGVEMYVIAALARTKGDINYRSGEKLDHNLLLLFPYKLYSNLQNSCHIKLGNRKCIMYTIVGW